jgi:hypothetical protein
MPITKYHDFTEYEEAFGAFTTMGGAFLFEFARYGNGNRDTIIANYLARTVTMTRSVLELYRLGDFQDCWVLHRSMMDRLFHLEHLIDTDGFEAYEEWSFMQQYNATRRAREDPLFRAATEGPFFQVTPEQRERAKQLKKNPPAWSRPKAEEVAHKLNVHFLYRYGYDFASTHVHPMANDGLRDFYSITGLEPAPEFPDERVALSNTLLIATMIAQSCLNGSSMLWRVGVYEFLAAILEFLRAGGVGYRASFVKLGRAIEGGMHLSAPRPAG